MSSDPIERLQRTARELPTPPTLLVAPDTDPVALLGDRVRSAARLASAPAPLSSLVDAVESASRWIDSAPVEAPKTLVDRWIARRSAPEPAPASLEAPPRFVAPLPSAVASEAASGAPALEALLEAIGRRDLAGPARAEVARLIASALAAAEPERGRALREALSILVHG